MSAIGATLFTEVTYPLSMLIENIELGQIGLPDIQRPFVWGNTKVRDLLDSMYKGYPVGYLLFWSSGSNNGQHQIGTGHKQLVPGLLIVDGQQRLTSLYAVVKGVEVVRRDYKKERISIAFCPLDGTFAVTDAAIRRDPAWIADISSIWAPSTNIFKLVGGYLTRLRASHEVSPEDEETAQTAIARLQNLLSYPFTALQLSHSLTEEQVADVFVRVNSKGTTLNQTDFILTLMSVYWDEGRTALEKFCAEARQAPSHNQPSPFNRFVQPSPDQLLRVSVGLGFRRARMQHVYNILRGKDLDTGEFSEERRDSQFAILATAQSSVLDLQHWHDFLKCLIHAGVRSASMITSETTVMYTYVLYLIGRREVGVDPYPLRVCVARWYYMAAMTQRYTGSPESAMEADLARLRGVESPTLFLSVLDQLIRDELTEDYWQITLPNALVASSARTPSLYAYYAALNILSARALFSSIKVEDLLDPAIKAPKSGVERHHLFPRGYLERIGVSDRRQVNQIANYAHVEWGDNIKISDKAPTEYLPAYRDRFSDDEWREMAYWHALPNGWEQMAYEDFLQARRRLMARVIRDAFEKLG